jgi:hypothetical protein
LSCPPSRSSSPSTSTDHLSGAAGEAAGDALLRSAESRKASAFADRRHVSFAVFSGSSRAPPMEVASHAVDRAQVFSVPTPRRSTHRNLRRVWFFFYSYQPPNRNCCLPAGHDGMERCWSMISGRDMAGYGEIWRDVTDHCWDIAQDRPDKCSRVRLETRGLWAKQPTAQHAAPAPGEFVGSFVVRFPK